MTQTYATTPFGRRPVTLGQIAREVDLRRQLDEAARPGSNHPAAVNKWTLLRHLGEIRDELGLSDRSLVVLSALLSFQPETALTLPARPQVASDDDVGQADDAPAGAGEGGPACDLVVFPSNRSLGQRAHGMAEATLRRHLAALVQAGLILRRDSPNGKRYARAVAQAGDDDGREAFGFDLTPLVLRAPVFEAMAQTRRARQREVAHLRQRITLLRRDIAKYLDCAMQAELPGDWSLLRQRLGALPLPARGASDPTHLRDIASALASLREEASKALEQCALSSDSSGNATHFERQYSYSNTHSCNELEPSSKEAGGRGETTGQAGAPASAEQALASGQPQARPEAGAEMSGAATGTGHVAVPLGLAMEACPDLHDYAPLGRVRDWGDLRHAARAVRPMLGISPQAWQEAVEVLGEGQACLAIAAILQRCEHSSEAKHVPGAKPGSIAVTVNGSPAIRSPGGYLRALTQKAKQGDFALGPVLMAQIGQRQKARAAGRPG